MSIKRLQFSVFIREKENETVLLMETTLGNEDILSNKWLKNSPLKVVIHGWKIESDESDEWCLMVKRGNFILFKTNSYNFNLILFIDINIKVKKNQYHILQYNGSDFPLY